MLRVFDNYRAVVKSFDYLLIHLSKCPGATKASLALTTFHSGIVVGSATVMATRATELTLLTETPLSVVAVLPEVRTVRCLESSAYANIILAEPAADGVKRRRKRNRWGDATDNKAAGLMGLPTMIQANMTSEQLEAYTLHLRIEEISQKLRINDVIPGDGDRCAPRPTSHALSLTRDRSPSPPPQYDNFGRRVNTREFRYRKKLEDERHKLIEKAMKTIPNYHPPSDYRRPTKTQEKVYVPVNDYPEINFSMLTNPLTLLQALCFSNLAVLYRLLIFMRRVAALYSCPLTIMSCHLVPQDSTTNT